MADENNDLNTEEIQETSVPEETAAEEPAAETENQTDGNKTHGGGFGKVVFVLFVLMIAGAAGVPQSRNMILEKFRELTSEKEVVGKEQASVEEAVVGPEVAEVAVRQISVREEMPEPEEIVSRLEQLENAREFENAEEVIASAETENTAVAENADYKALAEQQQALLAEMERLRARIDQIHFNGRRELKELEERIPDVRRLDARISAVHSREDGMEQRLVDEGLKIARLENGKADASAVLSLMARMEAAEQKIRISNAEKERAVALLLAVYQLREAAMSGQGFAMERQSALALADSYPRIAEYLRSLSGVADRGVHTKQSLLHSFDTYADQAVLSESLSTKKDWFHQAVNSLKSLVIIRRTDVTDAEPTTQTVLARAGLAVQDEDLGEAVLILKDLTGSAADTMREWVLNAERYIAVKRTVNETISAVLAMVYTEQLKGE